MSIPPSPAQIRPKPLNKPLCEFWFVWAEILTEWHNHWLAAEKTSDRRVYSLAQSFSREDFINHCVFTWIVKTTFLLDPRRSRRRGPINSVPSVRLFVRNAELQKTALRIFLKLWHKLGFQKCKKVTKPDFSGKIHF